jgi:hypothetical protein
MEYIPKNVFMQMPSATKPEREIAKEDALIVHAMERAHWSELSPERLTLRELWRATPRSGVNWYCIFGFGGSLLVGVACWAAVVAGFATLLR